MAFTEWVTHGPYTESTGQAVVAGWPTQLLDAYLPMSFGVRPDPATLGVFAGGDWLRGSWLMQQAYFTGTAPAPPLSDAGARACALAHAAEGDVGSDDNWTAGQCAALVGDVAAQSYFGGGVSLRTDGRKQSSVRVGFEPTAAAPYAPVFGSPRGANYAANVDFAIAYMGRRAAPPGGWSGPESEGRATVPPAVLAQIPGFDAEALAASTPDRLPEVIATRVVASMQAVVEDPQPMTAPAITLGFHARSRPTAGRTFDGVLAAANRVTPYSQLGAAVTSIPNTVGAAGAVITADLAEGETFGLDVSSSRVAALTDEGAFTEATAFARIIVDAAWTVRVRYWRPDPDPGDGGGGTGTPSTVAPSLRWRQRDDGLGLSGVARQRRGSASSQQASLRHLGGYR